MNGQAVFYALAVLLPLSALIARRPPTGLLVKSALGWIAIFAFGLVLVGQRDRVARMTHGLFSDQSVVGGEARIRQSADGHFWAEATINGVARRMLIDSGATMTAVSVATAKAAGLDLAEDPFPLILNTANGPVAARRATAASVAIGTVAARDLGVVVAPEFGDTDVIGMNFLSRLGSWRVEQGTLVLTP